MKKLINLLLSLFILTGCIRTENDLGQNPDSETIGNRDIPYEYKNWMKNLDPDAPLHKINIPGTHDSGAKFFVCVGAAQNLNITEQLNAGVRFLDIRLGILGGGLGIYHGVSYQFYKFGTILGEIKKFMDGNPSEVLFIAIKNETKMDNKIFSERLIKDLKSTKFGIENKIATKQINGTEKLQDFRGKVVLIKRFNWDSSINFSDIKFKAHSGIDATVWHDNTITRTAIYKIQDFYKPSNFGGVNSNLYRDKFQNVQNLIDERIDTAYKINYVSIAGAVGGPCISTSSNIMTPKVINHLSSVGKNVAGGILIFDFINQNTTKHVINANVGLHNN